MCVPLSLYAYIYIYEYIYIYIYAYIYKQMIQTDKHAYRGAGVVGLHGPGSARQLQARAPPGTVCDLYNHCTSLPF